MPSDALLLTPQDAADILGMPKDTLRLWRYRGTGPAYVKVGRHIRYKSADLDRWIESQRVDPEAA